MRIVLPVVHATSDGAVGSFIAKLFAAIAKLFAAKERFSGSPLSDIRPDAITAAPRRCSSPSGQGPSRDPVTAYETLTRATVAR